MATVSVILTAQNMGPDATEADFDAWANYVAARASEWLGFEVDVDQHAFCGGPAADTIVGGTDEQRESLREALSHDLWDQACADAFMVPDALPSTAEEARREQP